MSWFGSNHSKWDPGNWSGLGDVPIVGDVWKGITGDPGAIAAAYDKQIQASKDAAAQMQKFLTTREAHAEQYYQPLQHMFSNAYGTEGMQAPQVPQAPGGPLSRMYGGK